MTALGRPPGPDRIAGVVLTLRRGECGDTWFMPMLGDEWAAAKARWQAERQAETRG